MRAAVGCSLLAALLSAGCAGGAPAPPFKPVADTRLLMEAVIDPTVDVIWDSVATIVTIEKTEEIRPRTPEEWTVVRNAAITLAETGNLLMMAGRAADDGEWMKASEALIETSVEAQHAAEARDADKLFTVGGHIYNACTNCHQKYWADGPTRP